MIMDLHLEEVLLVRAGTAPTVAVKSDPGAAALPQWLHCKGVATGGACWLFLRLVLCSSEASCTFFSSLLRQRRSLLGIMSLDTGSWYIC